MNTEIVMGRLPITVPAERDPAEVIADIVRGMEVADRVRALFPGRSFLEGWGGRVTIVPALPGQHSVLGVYVDVVCECEPDAEKAQTGGGRWWQSYSAPSVVFREELHRYGPDRFAELVRWRVGQSLGKLRLVTTGYCDDPVVSEFDQFPPGFLDEDARPDHVVKG